MHYMLQVTKQKTSLNIFTNIDVTKKENSLIMELKTFKWNGLLKNSVRNEGQYKTFKQILNHRHYIQIK